MTNLFIVCRQWFFQCSGFHYQVSDDNPVTACFLTEDAAIDYARNVALRRIESHPNYTIKEMFGVASNIPFKVGIMNEYNVCDLCYTVIKESVLV